MSDLDRRTFLISERQARTFIGRCWNIDTLESAAELAAAARPV